MPQQAPAPGDPNGFGRRVAQDYPNTAVVQRAHKADRIDFTWLVPWPGEFICAEGHYEGHGKSRRPAVFIGDEFGTVSWADLIAAAREVADARFDVLISIALNHEANATEFTKFGRTPVLKAQMNAELHMAKAPNDVWCSRFIFNYSNYSGIAKHATESPWEAITTSCAPDWIK